MQDFKDFWLLQGIREDVESDTGEVDEKPNMAERSCQLQEPYSSLASVPNGLLQVFQSRR
jgi:hypothetical protein